MMNMKGNGKIIVITAPSGAGKTSITHYLLKHYPQICFSVSAATRKPRGEEKDGQDYYFMSQDDFENKINNQDFIEWEMVYEGNYYGTLKTEIERIWAEGKTPMLDIDVKGAIHVKSQFKNNCLSLFIQPPSIEVLQKRLEGRGTDSAENIATRVSKAAYELSFSHHFDFCILNEELTKACSETENIVCDFLEIKK
ncbi:MAG: guanylate kinase [Bacteroidota bacterium]